MSARVADDRLTSFRAAFDAARASWGEQGETSVETAKPGGWLAAAERVVAHEGMNVNRAGVVFVPAVERPSRDLAAPALRLGDASQAVFAELLELE